MSVRELTPLRQHPLDTVKVRLQLRGSRLRGPLAVLAAARREAGSVAGAVALLYRGGLTTAAGAACSSSLYFSAYETAKAAGCPPPLAALLGNALSSVFLVPKEVLKSRLQAGAHGGVLGVARAAGLRGLYAGYWPTLLRNAPSNVLSFSSYELLRRAALSHRRRGGTGAEELPSGITAAAGALSGALAAVMTHPLDLVKTRLQTQGVGPAAVGTGMLYSGVLPTLRTVLAAEGPRGLARGLGVRLFYNAAFSAVGLATFEAVKSEVTKSRTKDLAE